MKQKLTDEVIQDFLDGITDSWNKCVMDFDIDDEQKQHLLMEYSKAKHLERPTYYMETGPYISIVLDESDNTPVYNVLDRCKHFENND